MPPREAVEQLSKPVLEQPRVDVPVERWKHARKGLADTGRRVAGLVTTMDVESVVGPDLDRVGGDGPGLHQEQLAGGDGPLDVLGSTEQLLYRSVARRRLSVGA